jgi:hypothetical protein
MLLAAGGSGFLFSSPANNCTTALLITVRDTLPSVVYGSVQGTLYPNM